MIERRVVRRIVRALLAAGYEVSVNNGGDYNEIPYTKDFELINKTLFATDEEHILCRLVKNAEIIKTSFVFLVYGNSGWDVVNDYGTSLEPVMEPINRWADELSEKFV